MKVLVTGVKGQLGFDVVNELKKRGHTPIGVDVDDMDITDAVAVEKVITDAAPDAVIHCAAYTAVDKAEDNDANLFASHDKFSQIIADQHIPLFLLLDDSICFIYFKIIVQFQRSVPVNLDRIILDREYLSFDHVFLERQLADLALIQLDIRQHAIGTILELFFLWKCPDDRANIHIHPTRFSRNDPDILICNFFRLYAAQRDDRTITLIDLDLPIDAGIQRHALKIHRSLIRICRPCRCFLHIFRCSIKHQLLFFDRVFRICLF